ncbi:ABC transporter ATP-binding protein [Anaerosporobacter sp.]|uniref:ABC transporter ATP-binding protein n=1 Tax=Anaerosporobacter sp. TaxID=1872529 RepID=UPI00286EFC77|nr:ABC transporter ATP-binding protein [Anaerosporobacter sp.]
MAKEILQIKNLDKKFIVNKQEVHILKDINLNVQEGEFITIVGHSGCGKSTLLKIIAGLVGYEEGEVIRNGKKVTQPDTDCGMVFQEHRLLPWLKIKDNIGFGIKNLDKAERENLVQKHIELVGLKGFENAYPSQLSGGMSQRAAIARGLVANPSILLLDEPFGALDALTRIQMQKEILRIQKEEKTTMIMVTHDIDEAIYLGKRIIVMSARPGEIKSILTIESSAARNRGSSEFSYYKKKILNHFFEESEETIEYNL